MKKNILILLLIASSNYLFAQEITGTTRTSDKYSEAIREINSGYFENNFSAFDKFISNDATLTINGENFNKSQVREGFSMHHKLYKNIKMPMNFVETTFYDENNNNQVWSHLWGGWQGTSRRTGKADIPNPVNVSFKWVDGKIVSATWIFDPTSLNEEIIASQK
tara:strand:+ start:809 stop:1300 length:492 start_codon:yes stop_codon:yes gene_type:complete